MFETLPITAITISASVTKIGMMTFYSCSSLAEVTVGITADAIPSGGNMGKWDFSGIAVGAKLCVPTGTKELYEAADQWKDFSTIEEYNPSALPPLHDNAIKAHKSMVNGQVLIRKENKTYSALGQEVR